MKLTGLATCGVLDMIRSHADICMYLLHRPDDLSPLTVDKLLKLFVVKYSPAGSNRRLDEEVVYMNFHFFLKAVEG
jgi:hypothetical protein